MDFNLKIRQRLLILVIILLLVVPITISLNDTFIEVNETNNTILDINETLNDSIELNISENITEPLNETNGSVQEIIEEETTEEYEKPIIYVEEIYPEVIEEENITTEEYPAPEEITEELNESIDENKQIDETLAETIDQALTEPIYFNFTIKDAKGNDINATIEFYESNQLIESVTIITEEYEEQVDIEEVEKIGILLEELENPENPSKNPFQNPIYKKDELMKTLKALAKGNMLNFVLRKIEKSNKISEIKKEKIRQLLENIKTFYKAIEEPDLLLDKKIYDIKITLPSGSPLKEMFIEQADLDNTTGFIKIDDTPEDDSSAEIYAIDPTALNFTTSTVKRTAKGTELYKCKEWNFEEQTCYGEWIKIMDLHPGEEYNLTLTPEDPAYSEKIQPDSSAGIDTFVNQNAPNTNYGSNTLLAAGEQSSNYAGILLKFDVSHIPSSASIDSARIKLYFYDSPTNPANAIDLSTRLITSDWNETTVTWNTKPIYSSQYSDKKTLTNNYGWTEWDVTEGVQRWVNGSSNNYGVAIVPDQETASTDKRFYSSDYSNESLHPVLEINYTTIAPPNITILWPANNTEHGDGKIILAYNVTAEQEINNCKLIENSNVIAEDNFVTRNKIQTLTKNVEQDGTYTVYLNCTDSSGQSGISEAITITVNSTKSDVYGVVKDANDEILNVSIVFTQSSITKYTSSGTIHALTVIDGIYNITITPNNSTIQSIIFKNINISKGIAKIVDIDNPTNKQGFAELYAIDPTALNFTNATVRVIAKANTLYKCKEWNFSTQTCEGNWILFKTGLVPGQEYSFELTPEDPGFGEINATNAIHLNQNYGFISDIFSDVEHRDSNWSEPIYENEFVRVVYQANLTNGSIIDLYARNPNSTSTWFEVYSAGTTNPLLGKSKIFNSGGEWDFITINNLSTQTDTFDFKIVNNGSETGFLEFDYIHDAPPGTWVDSGLTCGPSNATNGSVIICSITYTCTARACVRGPSGFYLQDDGVRIDDSACSDTDFICNGVTITGTCANPAENDATCRAGLGATGCAVGTTLVVSYNFTACSGVETPTSQNTITPVHEDDDTVLDNIALDDTYNQVINAVSVPDNTPPGTITNLGSSAQGTTWIYWNWTNPSDADFNSTIIFIDGSNVANITSNTYNATGFSCGTTHNITIHTKDHTGNINTTNIADTASTNTCPDTTPPAYSNISGPVNPSTYSSSANYNFNITWTDNTAVDKVILEFNGTNYTDVSNSGTVYYRNFGALAAGIYIYKWHANDTSNNWNTAPQQIFTINQANTTLTINTPGTITYGMPANTSCSANNNQVIPVLTRNGVPVSNPDMTVLGSAVYSYSCTNNATQNYTAASTNALLTVLKANSTLTLTASSWNQTYGTQTTVNCTADNIETQPVLYRNGVPVSIPDTQTLAAGTYNYSCIASSTQNYSAPAQQQNTLTINKASSQVNLLLDGTDGNITANYGAVVNETGQLITGEGQIELYEQGTLAATGNNTITAQTGYYAIGSYNVTVKHPATQNYTASQETHWIKVQDSMPPTVTLNHPVNGFNTTNTTINFNWTAADNVNTSLYCQLIIDAIINATNINSSNSIPTNYSVAGFSTGQHNWSVKCTDAAGNVNTALTRNFTISIISNITNTTNKTQPTTTSTTGGGGGNVAARSYAADSSITQQAQSNAPAAAQPAQTAAEPQAQTPPQTASPVQEKTQTPVKQSPTTQKQETEQAKEETTPMPITGGAATEIEPNIDELIDFLKQYWFMLISLLGLAGISAIVIKGVLESVKNDKNQ